MLRALHFTEQRKGPGLLSYLPRGSHSRLTYFPRFSVGCLAPGVAVSFLWFLVCRLLKTFHWAWHLCDLVNSRSAVQGSSKILDGVAGAEELLSFLAAFLFSLYSVIEGPYSQSANMHRGMLSRYGLPVSARDWLKGWRALS